MRVTSIVRRACDSRPGRLLLAGAGLVLVGCLSAKVAPVAMAGPDQTVRAGTQVELDGSESSAQHHKPLQLEWTQTMGPQVTLGAATSSIATFRAPDTGSTLAFELTVSDGHHTAVDAATVFVRPGDPKTTTVTEEVSPRPTAADPLLQTGRLDPAVLAEDTILPEHLGSGSIQLMPLARWPVFEEFDLAAGESRRLSLTATEAARVMARATWRGSTQPVQMSIEAAGATEILGTADGVPPDRGIATALVDVQAGNVGITLANPGPDAVTVAVVAGTLPATALEPADD